MNEEKPMRRSYWVSFGRWRLVFYRRSVSYLRSELPVFGFGLAEELD